MSGDRFLCADREVTFRSTTFLRISATVLWPRASSASHPNRERQVQSTSPIDSAAWTRIIRPFSFSSFNPRSRVTVDAAQPNLDVISFVNYRILVTCEP